MSNGHGIAHGHEETFQIEEEASASGRKSLWAEPGRGGRRGSTLSSAGTSQSSTACSRHRRTVVATAIALLAGSLIAIYPQLRREFYPDVDSGAFEMTVRAPSGTRIETHRDPAGRGRGVSCKRTIDPKDLQLYLTEIGVTPDWSAAFTPNAGPMDAVVRVQLNSRAEPLLAAVRRDRSATPGQGAEVRRPGVCLRRRRHDPRGDERGQVDADQHPGHGQGPGGQRTGWPSAIRRAGGQTIDGVVDARVIQRLNYPEYMINVDRKKAAELGLTQEDVMRNVVAALNSSIQFNKRNFWIDPVNKNQYYVGVQYRENDIKTVETMLNVPVTGPKPAQTRCRSGTSSTIDRTNVPTEVTHLNIQPTIELTMGVSRRDLGHVADDVTRALDEFGKPVGNSTWLPYDPVVEHRRRHCSAPRS